MHEVLYALNLIFGFNINDNPFATVFYTIGTVYFFYLIWRIIRRKDAFYDRMLLLALLAFGIILTITRGLIGDFIKTLIFLVTNTLWICLYIAGRGVGAVKNYIQLIITEYGGLMALYVLAIASMMFTKTGRSSIGYSVAVIIFCLISLVYSFTKVAYFPIKDTKNNSIVLLFLDLPQWLCPCL